LKNSKAQQRNQLVMELGILIQPFVELIKPKSPPNISKYRVACAKVQSGDAAWRNTARTFASFADDIFMNVEFQKISHVNECFLREISAKIEEAETTKNLANLQTQCAYVLERLKENFYQYISEIPVEWEPEIFPANTPFTAYLKIKEALSLATTRIHYFDRYLKVDFFDVFLRNVARDIEIRLVTTSGNNQYGIKGVLAVSELARKEFSNYQLIEVSPKDLHDRNLRVDDSLFSLGPGIDRAGLALTNFGPSDSSAKAFEQIEAIIGLGDIVHRS